MSHRTYFDWAEGSPPPPPVPMRRDDPLAAAIRAALDARRLRWDEERTVELMERINPGVTTGIEVEESQP